MPVNRPGNIYYTTNDESGSLEHGQLVVADEIVGVAIKQKPVSWKLGLADQAVIAVNEKYALITKGIVEVTIAIGSFAKGDDVYLAAASTTDGVTTFALSETNTGTPVGRVVEVPGDGRGVPTGRIRIDLDKKDSI